MNGDYAGFAIQIPDAGPYSSIWAALDLFPGGPMLCGRARRWLAAWGDCYERLGRLFGRRAARGAAQAAKAIDPNRLHHIFGQAKHKLGPLLEKFASQETAFRAVESATQAAVRKQGLSGVFRTTVRVGGQEVGVKGAVVGDTVRVATFWIP